MDKPLKVWFYLEEDSVLAVFIEHWQMHNGRVFTQCYAHMGQHDLCHWEYYIYLPKAFKDRYTPLAKELEAAGYTLDILNKD
jgi:hypothetical protein